MIIHIDGVLLTSEESKYFLLMHMHYWENENPRWMITVPFQHLWSVNCWYGIVGDHVIGPYFFEGRLTGQVYASFLQNVMAVAPTTPDDMKERIRRACAEITPQILAEVRRSFHQRINKCLQVEGDHFKHLQQVDPNQG